MAAHWLVLILAATLSLNVIETVRYEPNWASIDSRPLPDWYDKAKLGIFIHWGVFSVPSFSSEWFWWNWQGGQPLPAVVEFMAENYRPDFTYADFGPQLTAEFFDGKEWASMFNASGAEYVVFVSKHHEGFTNWPSKYSFNWNSMDVGPKRDIVGELADAIRQTTNIHFGLYHSLFEWFHPLYLQDKANNFQTQEFVISKTMPELYEIVNRYKPEVVWSDGDWEAPDTYWNSTGFLAWLYNDSPVKDVVVTNDRWGKGVTCHHGGYYTCSDRYNPGTLQKHKFENAMTIDKYSWGFRRMAPLKDYLIVEEIIRLLMTTVSCGGNLLMNVGPEKDGRISPIFEERLRELGQWMAVNGEAVYSSHPWTYQNQTQDIWYTSKPNTMGGVDVYATLLTWPSSTTLTLPQPQPTASTTVTMLGYGGGAFSYSKTGNQGMIVTVPQISFNQLPCQWAWVLKITNVSN